MRFFLFKICLAIVLASSMISCQTGSSGTGSAESDNRNRFVPGVEEVNTVSWRHIENLPKIRPVAGLVLGVLNDNWDRMQKQFDIVPVDILRQFSDVFMYASNTDDGSKINDVVVMPVQLTAQETLTLSGNTDEILKDCVEKIELHNFNSAFLIRIDYYEPGTKYSPSGDEFNPEMKLTFWFVNAEGKMIWSSQTAVRTIKPLPPKTAIDHKKSNQALLNKAFEEVKIEFLKFWKSPEVVARMQSAKVVEFNTPKMAGDSGPVTPKYSRPLGGSTTLEGAGFSDNSD